MRRCLVCRKTAPKQEFWRVVRVYPTHTIVVDMDAIAPEMGRSAYLCPQESCLKLAQKKNRLSKVLKAPVPESVYDLLWQRLISFGQKA